MAAETHPYVGARGPTKGKFGQTMSPAVAAFVIKLIVPPSHAALNIQAAVVADGTTRKKVSLLDCCRTCGVHTNRIPEADLFSGTEAQPVCNYLAILDLIHLADANCWQAQNPSGSQIKSYYSHEKWRLLIKASLETQLDLVQQSCASLFSQRTKGHCLFGVVLFYWVEVSFGQEPGCQALCSVGHSFSAWQHPICLLKDSQRISWFTNWYSIW